MSGGERSDAASDRLRRPVRATSRPPARRHAFARHVPADEPLAPIRPDLEQLNRRRRAAIILCSLIRQKLALKKCIVFCSGCIISAALARARRANTPQIIVFARVRASVELRALHARACARLCYGREINRLASHNKAAARCKPSDQAARLGTLGGCGGRKRRRRAFLCRVRRSYSLRVRARATRSRLQTAHRFLATSSVNTMLSIRVLLGSYALGFVETQRQFASHNSDKNIPKTTRRSRANIVRKSPATLTSTRLEIASIMRQI